EAMQIEAVGKQWHWSFRLPGADGELGASDVRHLSPDNPLGVDPDDPRGQDDIIVASPVVHMPVGQPIHALLRSTDVLHNFAVPQFRVKMDLVPGLVTYQWFTPTVPGAYEILCEELCGVGHFAMRGRVVVDTREDYEAWLATQPTFAQTLARPAGNAAAGAANYAVCAACHGTQGEGNQQLNAPKIAGQPAWYLRRQLRNYQQGIRGTAPGDTYGPQMAPMAQTVAAEPVLENVIAYIESLPGSRLQPTVIGDAARGRTIYTTCALCHGPNGEGRWTANAPPLAGQSDWYLVRQLEYFRDRIRGGHPQDVYGDQMHLMTSMLSREGAIADVVAYINTL